MYFKNDKKIEIQKDFVKNFGFKQLKLKERYVGGEVVVANEFDEDGHNHTYECVKKLAHDYLRSCLKLDLQHGDVDKIKTFLSNREGVSKYTNDNGKEIVEIDFEILEKSIPKSISMKKSVSEGEEEGVYSPGTVVDCCFISNELVELIKNDKIKAGTFYLGTIVEDDEVVKMIENNEITTFSPKGKALGREVEENE